MPCLAFVLAHGTLVELGAARAEAQAQPTPNAPTRRRTPAPDPDADVCAHLATDADGDEDEPRPVTRAPGPLPVEVLGPLNPASDATHDWNVGAPRLFASGIVDLGYLFARPRFSFGYGKPHHTWFGIDANPLLAGEGAGGYLGLRGALPWIDLRIGARGFYTFRRSFLCPTSDRPAPERCASEPAKDSFTREQLESRIGDQSAYITLEAELTANQQLGPGILVTELAASAVSLVDDGYFVYEERIQVIADPPWILRGRLGYLFFLEPSRSITVGLLTELLSVPRRDMLVWRAGVFGGIRLYRDLEARGAFIPAIAARDSLGADGGNAFFLGLRYRWATGPTPDSVEHAWLD